MQSLLSRSLARHLAFAFTAPRSEFSKRVRLLLFTVSAALANTLRGFVHCLRVERLSIAVYRAPNTNRHSGVVTRCVASRDSLFARTCSSKSQTAIFVVRFAALLLLRLLDAHFRLARRATRVGRHVALRAACHGCTVLVFCSLTFTRPVWPPASFHFRESLERRAVSEQNR